MLTTFEECLRDPKMAKEIYLKDIEDDLLDQMTKDEFKQAIRDQQGLMR